MLVRSIPVSADYNDIAQLYVHSGSGPSSALAGSPFTVCAGLFDNNDLTGIYPAGGTLTCYLDWNGTSYTPARVRVVDPCPNSAASYEFRWYGDVARTSYLGTATISPACGDSGWLSVTPVTGVKAVVMVITSGYPNGSYGWTTAGISDGTLSGGSMPAPMIKAVYACKDGTSPCNASTAVGYGGWSPATHAVVLTVVLATTGANTCDLWMYETDGTGAVHLGGIVDGGSLTTTVATYDTPPGRVLQPGIQNIVCTDNADATLFSQYSIVLQANGLVGGATNQVFTPGVTPSPGADVGTAPLESVYNAWNGLVTAYQKRAPFVFLKPTWQFFSGTWTDLHAASLPAPSGHYGPVSCPGYSVTMPTTPPIQYVPMNTASPTHAASWPSGAPAASFTILRCEDFAQITDNWSWWHQARGLMDLGLYVGYGLIWIRRLMPRFQMSG